MKEHNMIIDYIIEQSDRYDIKNMQFEQDIIQAVKKSRMLLSAKIYGLIVSNIDTQLKMEKLLISINGIYTDFNNSCKRLLLDKFSQYSRRAYEYTGDLIELGNELFGKLSSNIKELKSTSEYDENTIEFIRKHAFDQLTGHSYEKISKIRAELGNMMLDGHANKANVRAMIEKVLNTNRSKAEEITQYELSRAYNYGTMARLKEYQRVSGKHVRKYWHGFKYSDVTCEYCRDRIGMILDVDDDEETLPAHIRCRCVWLPLLDGWDKPTSLISRANMLNTAYSKDMIYQRVSNRLDIDYAEYIHEDAILDYLSGDRSQKVINALSNARSEYIRDIVSSFDIQKDTSGTNLSSEFNMQMDFWKTTIATAMADKNNELVDKSVEAIKGVMVLPWNGEQMDKWNTLLSKMRR